MHYGAVVKVIGRLMGVEALLLLLPLAVSLCYGETDWIGFATAAAAAAVMWGAAEVATRRRKMQIEAREGFVLTAVTWIMFSLAGLIPFTMCTEPLGFTDALLETISGFTTTGVTVYADPGNLGHGVLLWRALTQWIGGLGIIFFMLAVLPALNGTDGISMFHAEATGIFHTHLHPRIRQSAIALWGVYGGLSLVCVVLLWAGPMSFFDAVCQTFSAISTGGFTTHAEGLEYWHSGYVDTVLTVMMLVGGLNFMLVYGAVASGRWRPLATDRVVRCYLCIIIGAWLLEVVAAYTSTAMSDMRHSLLMPLTHVVSAITSTGFTVAGSDTWGQASLMVTMMLMMTGACAGSTSGGMKVDRMMVVYSDIRNNLLRTLHPRRTFVVRIGAGAIDTDTMSRISAFLFLYAALILASALAATFMGYTFTDSLFAAISTIGCNGLGYGVTAIAGGFAQLHTPAKYIFMFDMLAGRLELFAFMTLFIPSLWRR